MNQSTPSLENVRDRLLQARLDPKFKRQFPKILWEDIFSLIKEHSFDTVCRELALSPDFLSKKLGETVSEKRESTIRGTTACHQDASSRKLEETAPKEPAFREVFLEPLSATVIIEISRFDLKVRIEGPISCIDSLKTLFREG